MLETELTLWCSRILQNNTSPNAIHRTWISRFKIKNGLNLCWNSSNGHLLEFPRAALLCQGWRHLQMFCVCPRKSQQGEPLLFPVLVGCPMLSTETITWFLCASICHKFWRLLLISMQCSLSLSHFCLLISASLIFLLEGSEIQTQPRYLFSAGYY